MMRCYPKPREKLTEVGRDASKNIEDDLWGLETKKSMPLTFFPWCREQARRGWFCTSRPQLDHSGSSGASCPIGGMVSVTITLRKEGRGTASCVHADIGFRSRQFSHPDFHFRDGKEFCISIRKNYNIVPNK